MLSTFIFMICLAMMCIAFYGLYLLSERQIKHTAQGKFSRLTLQPARYKILCFALCAVSMLGLMMVYGYSVGFVVWWILASPLLLILILWVNPLKKSSK